MPEPMRPYAFQRDDIDAVFDGNGRGFIVAETGAGKSLIGAQVGIEGDWKNTLVVAPKGTHEKVWRKTIERQHPDARVRMIDGSEAGKDAMNALEWGERGWFVVSPQLFTKWKLGEAGIRPDLAIIDEAHQLSARGTKGNVQLQRLRAGGRLAMSGTIVRNKVENFWGLARWAYPGRNQARDIADENYERWVTSWMRTEYDRFAPRHEKIVGERVPGLFASSIPTYCQHFKRRHCCPYHPQGFLFDVPEPVVIEQMVELTANQRRMIATMEKSYISWLTDTATGGTRAAVAKLPIVARTRLRQMTLAEPSMRQTGVDAETGLPTYQIYFEDNAASPKYDQLIEDMDKVREPVVASTSSQQYASYAVKRLTREGKRAFEWSSANSQRKRDEALARFEGGDLDVIVGVTEAIGTGIDGLQDASGVLVELETSDDLTAQIQLEGRLDRRGQKREQGVLHYKVLAEGSMDQGIVSRQLERRLELNKSIAKQQRREQMRRAA